jgi:hypothetical protein
METNQEMMKGKMDANLKEIIVEMRNLVEKDGSDEGLSRKDRDQEREKPGTNGSRN